MTTGHSTCVLKLLLHLSRNEKTKNKVPEHCKGEKFEKFCVHYESVLSL